MVKNFENGGHVVTNSEIKEIEMQAKQNWGAPLKQQKWRSAMFKTGGRKNGNYGTSHSATAKEIATFCGLIGCAALVLIVTGFINVWGGK
jgi:hypothetical protein